MLTLNSFSFNNEYYRQIGGVSMGSGMGPSYAYLFDGYVEHQIREEYTVAQEVLTTTTTTIYLFKEI